MKPRGLAAARPGSLQEQGLKVWLFFLQPERNVVASVHLQDQELGSHSSLTSPGADAQTSRPTPTPLELSMHVP